jgi:hypothetical protein
MDPLQTRLDTLEQQMHTVTRRLRWWRGLAGGLVVLAVLTWALPLSTAQEGARSSEQANRVIIFVTSMASSADLVQQRTSLAAPTLSCALGGVLPRRNGILLAALTPGKTEGSEGCVAVASEAACARKQGTCVCRGV